MCWLCGCWLDEMAGDDDALDREEGDDAALGMGE